MTFDRRIGSECVDDVHEYENRRHHGNGQSRRLGLQDEKRLAETCKRKDRCNRYQPPEGRFEATDVRRRIIEMALD